VDYLERAKRKDEIPLLKKELEERKAEWLAKSKSIHANRLEAKSRLQRMVAQQKAFADVVLGERQAQCVFHPLLTPVYRFLYSVRALLSLLHHTRHLLVVHTFHRYANQKAEFDKKLAAQAEKQKELRALEEKRKKKEKEEDAKREAAVADERRLFEENRLANAKKKKVEDAERDQELERVAEKQKQREAELEERREKEQEEQREKAKLEREAPARDVRGPPTRDVRGPPARDTAPARAPAGAGGGWRDRERQREEQRTAPGPSVRADAPPTRAAEPDRWARDARAPGDDTRGGQGGYRAPARREDGPPARRDDPPRGDAGAGGRGGAYRPAVRRDEDSRGGGGAYRPPARGGGDGGGDRWQRGGALPAREARPTQSAQPTRGVGDAPPPAQGRGEDDGWTQATGRRPGAGRGRPPPAQ
jgi:translation initiation factor 3 subunit A